MAAKAHTDPAKSVLGIIAGGGRLPALLIEACQRAQREFFVLAFEDATEMEAITPFPHTIVRLGALGDAIAQLRAAGVDELVMAGKVSRPSLSTLRPDITAARLLTRLGTAFFGGDDALFKAIVSFLEDEGFHVIGAENVLREIIAPEGVLGKFEPDALALTDIAHGIKEARKLGEDDLGQAVIVRGGILIGAEDEHGTDALILRCHSKEKTRSGVLVKVKKPFQETRVDLPAIGPKTVENVHKSGLSGVAIEAGSGIIIDRAQVIALADKLGIFVVGVRG